jgi:hypothetical protein
MINSGTGIRVSAPTTVLADVGIASNDGTDVRQETAHVAHREGGRGNISVSVL